MHPRRERETERGGGERKRGGMKGQKARGGKERKMARGKRESLFARLYFCETCVLVAPATKVIPRHLRVRVGSGSRLETKSRESSLDFRRNQFSLCLCACRVRAWLFVCDGSPECVSVCVCKAHPRTLRSRVFNAFVAL